MGETDEEEGMSDFPAKILLATDGSEEPAELPGTVRTVQERPLSVETATPCSPLQFLLGT